MKNKYPKKRKKIHINIKNLQVFFFREGNSFVAQMPQLDLMTCGDSFEEAQQMAIEASSLFLEECIKMGTLEEVLVSLGWSKASSTKEWIPPPYITQESHHLSLSA